MSRQFGIRHQSLDPLGQGRLEKLTKGPLANAELLAQGLQKMQQLLPQSFRLILRPQIFLPLMLNYSKRGEQSLNQQVASFNVVPPPVFAFQVCPLSQSSDHLGDATGCRKLDEREIVFVLCQTFSVLGSRNRKDVHPVNDSLDHRPLDASHGFASQ